MADAYDFWAERVPRDVTAQIDDFWLRFSDIAPKIARHFNGQAPGLNPDGEVRVALGKLADRVACDFEHAADGTLALVVTAELYHSRRTLARAIVNRAPHLAGWSVSDTRWPVANIPDAARAILDRSRSEALAVSAIEPRRGAHRFVDLVAEGQGDAEFLRDQAGIIFSVLLGERADQDWLGHTEVRRPASSIFGRLAAPPRPRNDRWLSQFREQAVDVISAFEADRPANPFFEEPMRVEDTASFRLRPDGSDPAGRRDALTYQTRYRALVAARLAGARIGSLRFSRFGESFCGLKIRRTGVSPFNEVAQIATFGSRVEEALMAAKAGGVTGRAPGVEHVYIDLAVPDFRRVLDEEGVTGPAWLLFDEAGLEDNYLPLTSRTPPTPMS